MKLDHILKQFGKLEPDSFELLVRATAEQGLKMLNGDRAKLAAVYGVVQKNAHQVKKERDFWRWFSVLAQNVESTGEPPSGELADSIVARYGKDPVEPGPHTLGDRFARLAHGGWFFGPPLLSITWYCLHYRLADGFAPAAAMALLMGVLIWGAITFWLRPLVRGLVIRFFYSRLSWILAVLASLALLGLELLMTSICRIGTDCLGVGLPTEQALLLLRQSLTDGGRVARLLDDQLSAIPGSWVIGLIPTALVLFALSRWIHRRRYWVYPTSPGIGFYIVWLPYASAMTVLCFSQLALLVPTAPPSEYISDAVAVNAPANLSAADKKAWAGMEAKLKKEPGYFSEDGQQTPDAHCRGWLEIRKPLFSGSEALRRVARSEGYLQFPMYEYDGHSCRFRGECDVWVMVLEDPLRSSYVGNYRALNRIAELDAQDPAYWSRLREILADSGTIGAGMTLHWQEQLVTGISTLRQEKLPGFFVDNSNFLWDCPYFSINFSNRILSKALAFEEEHKDLILSLHPLNLSEEEVLAKQMFCPELPSNLRLAYEAQQRSLVALEALLYLKEQQAEKHRLPARVEDFPDALRARLAGFGQELTYRLEVDAAVISAFGPTEYVHQDGTVGNMEFEIKMPVSAKDKAEDAPNG